MREGGIDERNGKRMICFAIFCTIGGTLGKAMSRYIYLVQRKTRKITKLKVYVCYRHYFFVSPQFYFRPMKNERPSESERENRYWKGLNRH